jgi:hypothetical protein
MVSVFQDVNRSPPCAARARETMSAADGDEGDA